MLSVILTAAARRHPRVVHAERGGCVLGVHRALDREPPAYIP
jgi:hypothetical protein